MTSNASLATGWTRWRLTRGGDLVTRTIAGETVIVPIRGGVGDLDALFTLNPVGAFVWELLDGARTGGQILEALCREYDVPEIRAAADLEEFIEVLLSAGLIRPAG